MKHILKLHLKIPPVAQGLVALLLIWFCPRYFPIYRFEFVCQKALAVIISLWGLGVAVAALWAFIMLRTSVDPHHPDKASKLVVIGVYRYSRNPMYLGILLVLVSVALYLGTVSSFIIITGFIAFINKFQIEPEESVLREKFGDSYEQYLKNVGRWM